MVFLLMFVLFEYKLSHQFEWIQIQLYWTYSNYTSTLTQFLVQNMKDEFIDSTTNDHQFLQCFLARFFVSHYQICLEVYQRMLGKDKVKNLLNNSSTEQSVGTRTKIQNAEIKKKQSNICDLKNGLFYNFTWDLKSVELRHIAWIMHYR